MKLSPGLSQFFLEPVPPNNRPRPIDCLTVYLLALVYSTFAGRVFEPFFGAWAPPLFTVFLGLLPIAYAICFRFDLKETFRLNYNPLRKFVGGAFLSFGVVILVTCASVLALRFFPALPVSEKNLRTNVADGNVLRLILSVVILPAICEELLFRGFVLSGLEGRMRKIRAAVLCGFLFGALHLDPLQIPVTACVGFVLSWVALETGSVYVPVLMHGIHNATLLFIARIVLSRGSETHGDWFSPIFSGTDYFSIPEFCTVLASALLVFAGVRLIKKPVSGISSDAAPSQSPDPQPPER